jgi:hypothetical protein
MPRTRSVPQSGQYSEISFPVPSDGCIQTPDTTYQINGGQLGSKLLKIAAKKYGGVRAVIALIDPTDPARRLAVLTEIAQAFLQSIKKDCAQLDPSKVIALVGTTRDLLSRASVDATGNASPIPDRNCRSILRNGTVDDNSAVSVITSNKYDSTDRYYSGISLPITDGHGNILALIVQDEGIPPTPCVCGGSSSGASSGFFSSSSEDECLPIFDSTSSGTGGGFSSSQSASGSFVFGECYRTDCGYA